MTSGDSDYSNIRVLVIEDEVHIRQLIRRLLRQIGFTKINEASDGGSGFTEVIRTQPDVILCDIHMEPMDGLYFLKKLRDLGKPGISDLPVVFLTADTHQATVMAAKSLQVDAYIAKPISPKALQEKLDAVLRR